MHAKSLAGLTGLLLLASLATAHAQAPPPSPDANILYAHTVDTQDAKELEGWMNTLEADGGDTAAGPSGTCQQHTGTKEADDVLLTAQGVAIDRTYEFRMNESGTFTLDKAKIVANIHFGAGSCFGKVDITSTLVAGDVKVAEGKSTGLWYDNNAAAYPGVKIEAEPLVQEFDAETLVWKINVKGKTGGTGFLGVSKTRGSTMLTLPVLSFGGGAEPTVYEDIADALDAQYTLTNKTTQTYQYNWTSAGGDATLRYAGMLTNGSVQVLVLGGGKEEVNATVNGTFDETAEFTATEGPYQIFVSFQKAQGEAKASLTVAAPASLGTDGPTPTTNATANATDETGAPQDDNGAPVPAGLALLAPLVALALLRRRK